MAITRYRQGNATIVLSGELEAAARRAIEAAQGATIKVLEEAAEAIAADARSAWYQQVDRRTGKTGDIQVVTTIDTSRNEVRVGLGSSDARVDKRGRPVAALVRRPAATSLRRVVVSEEEFWRTPQALRSNFKPLPPREGQDGRTIPGDGGKGPWIFQPNPKASDGKNLYVELLRKPARAQIKALAPELKRALADALRRT